MGNGKIGVKYVANCSDNEFSITVGVMEIIRELTFFPPSPSVRGVSTTGLKGSPRRAMFQETSLNFIFFPSLRISFHSFPKSHYDNP